MFSQEAKMLAVAIFELRIILFSSVGPDAPYELRLAAHLAHALHNEALAVMEDRTCDVESALARIAALDQIIGGDDGNRISSAIRAIIYEKRSSN